MNNEIVLFKDGELEIEVTVSPDKDTVWLSQQQMAKLFDVKIPAINKQIQNIYEDDELVQEATISKMEIVQKEGNRNIKRTISFYNLDMIISVGYRVKSKRGIAFRKWANSVLKDYILKGYAENKKRLSVLNKTIEIQSKMLASSLGVDTTEVYEVVNKYTEALDLLDNYDHQCLKKPKGSNTVYKLSYREVRNLIDSMKFNSDVFGVEKENGKLNGILEAVYQNVYGRDVYPSIEEKAANLLYFLIKDHPFADGRKRIAAATFLEFLNKNDVLYKNNQQVITNNALVAITLMIAESNPKEKETMVTLVMNFLRIDDYCNSL